MDKDDTELSLAEVDEIDDTELSPAEVDDKGDIERSPAEVDEIDDTELSPEVNNDLHNATTFVEKKFRDIQSVSQSAVVQNDIVTVYSRHVRQNH